MKDISSSLRAHCLTRLGLSPLLQTPAGTQLWTPLVSASVTLLSFVVCQVLHPICTWDALWFIHNYSQKWPDSDCQEPVQRLQWPGMIAYTFNLCTWEAEAGGWISVGSRLFWSVYWVLGQLELHNKKRLCPIKQNKNCSFDGKMWWNIVGQMNEATLFSLKSKWFK